MRHDAGLCAGLVCVAMGVVAPTVGAQTQGSASEKAAAQALYEEGKQLLEAGKVEQACPKFEASQQLDAGVGTLLYLADCYGRAGRTASAWATFLEAASAAKNQGQSEREQLARDRAAALESKLSKLTLVGTDATSMQQAEVTLNGRSVPRASWGVPLPVDPGPQMIEVRAPNKKPWSTTLQIPPGASERRLEIPRLADAPESVPAAPSATNAPAETAEPSSKSGLRTAGWIVAGAGVVGVGVGSYFGLRAISKNDDSKAHCRTAHLCDSTGLALRDDAKDAATISTIAFAAGGALAAGGVALLVFAPSNKERGKVSVKLAPNVAAVEFGGSW